VSFVKISVVKGVLSGAIVFISVFSKFSCLIWVKFGTTYLNIRLFRICCIKILYGSLNKSALIRVPCKAVLNFGS
jgi:hypothetical protein